MAVPKTRLQNGFSFTKKIEMRFVTTAEFWWLGNLGFQLIYHHYY